MKHRDEVTCVAASSSIVATGSGMGQYGCGAGSLTASRL